MKTRRSSRCGIALLVFVTACTSAKPAPVYPIRADIQAITVQWRLSEGMHTVHHVDSWAGGKHTESMRMMDVVAVHSDSYEVIYTDTPAMKGTLLLRLSRADGSLLRMEIRDPSRTRSMDADTVTLNQEPEFRWFQERLKHPTASVWGSWRIGQQRSHLLRLPLDEHPTITLPMRTQLRRVVTVQGRLAAEFVSTGTTSFVPRVSPPESMSLTMTISQIIDLDTGLTLFSLTEGSIDRKGLLPSRFYARDEMDLAASRL